MYLLPYSQSAPTLPSPLRNEVEIEGLRNATLGIEGAQPTGQLMGPGIPNQAAQLAPGPARRPELAARDGAARQPLFDDAPRPPREASPELFERLPRTNIACFLVGLVMFLTGLCTVVIAMQVDLQEDTRIPMTFVLLIVFAVYGYARYIA